MSLTVIGAPPSLFIFPPLIAVVVVIEVISVEVIVENVAT
jgi:hypothetical protein